MSELWRALRGLSGIADKPDDAVFAAVSGGIEDIAEPDEDEAGVICPTSESASDGIDGISTPIPSPVGSTGELVRQACFCFCFCETVGNCVNPSGNVCARRIRGCTAPCP